MTPKALSNILRCLGNAISASGIEEKNMWIGNALTYMDIEKLLTKENK